MSFFLAACGGDDGPVQPNGTLPCASGFACSLEPVAVAGGRTFATISVGGEHSCAIESSGATFCWGSNRNGQLGSGTNDVFSSVPVRVAGEMNFVKVTAGALHSCALTSQGEAFCWGNGSSGALGTGLVEDVCGTVQCSRTPVQVIGGHEFTLVEAGFSHTCGISTSNTAYCWGSNEHGELGSGGFFSASSIPEPVTGSRTFSSISAGLNYTCALAVEQEVLCWGSGASDALGHLPAELCPSGSNGMLCSASPVAVETSLRFSQLSTGSEHACGITTAGDAYCWGDNAYGQIGVPGTVRSRQPLPVPVNGSSKVVLLSAAGRHSCALTLVLEPYCWGSNKSGETGSGVADESIATPASVHGGRIYAVVAGGGTLISSHTCALTALGRAYCWGSRELGQLGDGR